jgi:uncharacterized coiled-coil protein SlyX
MMISFASMLVKEVVMDDVTSRIVELEIRYSHLQDLVEELNVELTSANMRVDQLEREVKQLKDVISNLGPELIESPDE